MSIDFALMLTAYDKDAMLPPSNYFEVCMPQERDEEFLTPEEASAELGISRRTLERYANDKLIQRYRLGARVYFKRADVERLRERLSRPQPEDDQGDQ
jgi:excisionase family DNA binding protein